MGINFFWNSCRESWSLRYDALDSLFKTGMTGFTEDGLIQVKEVCDSVDCCGSSTLMWIHATDSELSKYNSS